MRRFITIAGLSIAAASPALAHSAARGFVLLLPTGWVITCGALAVLASFAIVVLLPCNRSAAVIAKAEAAPHATSLVSFALLLLLLWIGFAGPTDPAENLLPLVVWTLWWVVIVLLHPLAGNLWAFLNPFTGLAALAGDRARITYPERLAYLPAILIFAAFAWFQLVYPGPEDPRILARLVTLYAGITCVGLFLFGRAAWFGRVDPFAIFLRQLGAVAPLGIGLARLAPLPLSGICFVLLTLSSISFDGFANTFLWLQSIAVNPLDYPGRTALMGANTLGLAGAFAALALGFLAAVAMGWHLAGRNTALVPLAGRLVYSLIPISIAFHFAHYLSDTLVNLQYLARALGDPFETGADLLGLGDLHVTASFQNTASGALAIFTAQSLAIIAGHVAGVGVAHRIAAEESPGHTVRLEAPLAVFMVAYTAFGLWLLAAPAIS